MLGKLSGRKHAEPQANGEKPADPAKLAAELAAMQAENRRLKALVLSHTANACPYRPLRPLHGAAHLRLQGGKEACRSQTIAHAGEEDLCRHPHAPLAGDREAEQAAEPLRVPVQVPPLHDGAVL